MQTGYSLLLADLLTAAGGEPLRESIRAASLLLDDEARMAALVQRHPIAAKKWARAAAKNQLKAAAAALAAAGDTGTERALIVQALANFS